MFNIRVYGILVEKGKILVTDEFRLGTLMTKFPGGGLEFGEGTIDCLKREWREETGMNIHSIEHYYTTDFFQPSYKSPVSSQVINIYYLVQSEDSTNLEVAEKPIDFPELIEGIQRFRWIEISSLTTDEFTLPIDRVVVKKLIDDFAETH